jgi:hypothetical protein
MCIHMKHHNPYRSTNPYIFVFQKMNVLDCFVVDWLAKSFQFFIKFHGNKELFNVQSKNNLTTIVEI